MGLLRVDASTDVDLAVGRRQVVVGLLAAVALLNVANAWSIGFGADSPASRYLLLALERNPSTWFSALLLALAGSLAFVVGRGRTDAARWSFIAALLWFLSLDEVASFHERFGGIPVIPGIGSRGWAGVGVLLVGLVAVKLLPWAVALDAPLRFALFAGGAVFVTGAIGFEVLAGNREVVHGTDATYWALATIEENLEMLGGLVVVRGLLDHLATTGRRFGVGFDR